MNELLSCIRAEDRQTVMTFTHTCELLVPVCQPHLDAVSGPHPSDRLQVLQSAAQHHTHGLVTLLHLGQGLLVTQGSRSVVG